MAEIVYDKKEVELSRVYPFGTEKEVGNTEAPKKVTVLTMKELNGHDGVAMSPLIEKGKLAGYLQISASTGITYEEALYLADKDSSKLMEELAGF